MTTRDYDDFFILDKIPVAKKEMSQKCHRKFGD